MKNEMRRGRLERRRGGGGGGEGGEMECENEAVGEC